MVNDQQEQELKACPRCKTAIQPEHNFCWLCGLELHGTSVIAAQQNHQNVAAGTSASSGAGSVIGGLLVGVFGGVTIGLAMIAIFIFAVLNAISEFFDSCAGTATLLLTAVGTTIYSVVSWLF